MINILIQYFYFYERSHLNVIIPAIINANPITFLHSNATFSVPNNPNNSITYAIVNCAVTISITDFAGPNEFIL